MNRVNIDRRLALMEFCKLNEEVFPKLRIGFRFCKDEEAKKLLKKARESLFYSTKTVDSDIYVRLCNFYKKNKYLIDSNP